MKENTVILIIIIFLIATTSVVVNADQDFLTYKNSTYGIKIQHPSNWEKVEVDLPINMIVTFNPKTEDDSDTVIDILITPIPSDMALDNFTDDYIDLLRDIYIDFTIIESSQSFLAGNSAHKIVYTARMERDDTLKNVMEVYHIDTLEKVMEVWTVNNNKVYIISYYAEQKTYDNYLPVAQKMVDSFEINLFEIDTSSIPNTVNERHRGINFGVTIIIILFVILVGFIALLAIRSRHNKHQNTDTSDGERVDASLDGERVDASLDDDPSKRE